MQTIEIQLNLIKQTIVKISDDVHNQIIEILYRFNTFLLYQFLYQENTLFVKQWDIYDINLWRNIGSELNKKRPCVVISDNAFNNGNTVVVAPLKSVKEYTKQWVLTIRIDHDFAGLEKKSFVSLGNIREVSKKRMQKKIWKIAKHDLLKTQESLSIFFGIKKSLASRDIL